MSTQPTRSRCGIADCEGDHDPQDHNDAIQSGIAVDRGRVTEIRAHCVMDWDDVLTVKPEGKNWAFYGITEQGLHLDAERVRLFARALLEAVDGPLDDPVAAARAEGEREVNRRVHQIIRTFLDSRYDRLERVGLEKLVVVLRAQGVTDE